MIANVFILLGSLSFLIAALGLWRMPDELARLHAGTKASSLGVLLLAVGAGFRFPEPGVIALLAGMVVLVFLTAPLGCHAIAKRLVGRFVGRSGRGE
jgi:multicomponent Na+:H+ antiporter subunit G